MRHPPPSLPYNYGGNAFAKSTPSAPTYRPSATQRRNGMSDLSHRWFQTSQAQGNAQTPPPPSELPRPRRELPKSEAQRAEGNLLAFGLAELPSLLTRLSLSRVGTEELFLCALLLLLAQAGADRETLLLIAVLLFWN